MQYEPRNHGRPTGTCAKRPRARKLRPGSRATDEVQRDGLVQSLETHQLELEMQNLELREAYRRLEESNHAYIELYDFAPVGFLSLDRHGRILQVNLTASGMLETAR